ncbi:hypothetical protein OSTOST_07041, partial [Ostertagia ostertagi]
MDVPSSSTSSQDVVDDAPDGAPTHFLMELVTLDHLMMTSSSSKRSKFLILGTSTGGVSVYGRYSSSRKRLNTPSGLSISFNTKDGPVSALCVAPKEGLIAVGSDSGRVTSLMWSTDSKRLYSGHENGTVMVHYLDAKYLFRSSCAVVATFEEGQIVQLDVNGPNVLVSTQSASYVCNVDEKSVIQIGKKPRNGLMGACFISPAQEELSSTQQGGFILAARPNGRVWEANAAGVVYRTHQLRENATYPRPPIISCRNDYSCVRRNIDAGDAEARDAVTLSVLQHIIVD